MIGPVFFLDDDLDLCDLLKDLVGARGGDVKLAGSVDAMTNMRSEVLPCKFAFLDIELGFNQPNGINAYEWLKLQDFSGRIFFMTGHGAGHPLVKRARLFGTVEVLSKPVQPNLLLGIIDGEWAGRK